MQERLKQSNKKPGWLIEHNVISGIVSLVLGITIQVVSVVMAWSSIGDSDRPPPYILTLLGWLGVAVMFLAPVAFWIIIPAFREWWHTKRWLAWSSLIFSALVIYLAYVFLLQVYSAAL